MKSIKIELTQQQIEILQPLFDKAKSEYDKGDAGAVLAQIGQWDDGSGAILKAIFFTNEVCLKIQEITGKEPGDVWVEEYSPEDFGVSP